MTRKNLQTNGLQELKKKMAKLSEMPNVLDSELGSIAKKMRDTAKAMAPIEYGGLRESIRYRRVGYQRNKLGQFFKGSLGQHSVYVNLSQPSRGGTVADYFYLVHEHMSIGRTGDEYQPSQYSVMNSAMLGEVAGGRFMERARVKYEVEITKLLQHRANEFIKTLF
ncbi:HK97 gp10 family phage protein [Acinetobacter nosocomialis]|uniref:HK97 gp10 family phage protein n=1 Tax=Acinetobacter nosocomialis TaxID=106654 RepID=UPI0033A6D0B3